MLTDGAWCGGSDSKILRKAAGLSEAYMSRAVNGPEKRKITASAAGL